MSSAFERVRSGWPTEARKDFDRTPPVGWKKFAGAQSKGGKVQRGWNPVWKTGIGLHQVNAGSNSNTNTGKKVFTTSELS